MRHLAFLAVLALVSTVRAEEPTVESLIEKMKAIYEKATIELESVKDKSSAERAQDRLQQLTQMRTEVTREIAALNLKANERAKAQEKLDTTIAKPFESLQKQVARIAILPEALPSLAKSELVKEAAGILESRAKTEAKNVELALKTYLIKNEGNPPKELGELGRYLDKKYALIDPWGREYKLGTEKGPTGGTVYFVYTVSPFGDGKTKISSMNEKK